MSAAVVVLVVILVLVVIAALFFVSMYNRLSGLATRSENAWAQVAVQLRRRYDLIPNLVETVKGYASHERETFEEVTRARAALQQAQTPGEASVANAQTQAGVNRLIAVAEAYPELKASQNFQEL